MGKGSSPEGLWALGQPQRMKCPEWVPLGFERWELCLLVILGKTKFLTDLASPTSSSAWAFTEGEMWLAGCNSDFAASGSAAPFPDPFLGRWFSPSPGQQRTPCSQFPPLPHPGLPVRQRPARAGNNRSERQGALSRRAPSGESESGPARPRPDP